jgi:hypothetical protein
MQPDAARATRRPPSYERPEYRRRGPSEGAVPFWPPSAWHDPRRAVNLVCRGPARSGAVGRSMSGRKKRAPRLATERPMIVEPVGTARLRAACPAILAPRRGGVQRSETPGPVAQTEGDASGGEAARPARDAPRGDRIADARGDGRGTMLTKSGRPWVGKTGGRPALPRSPHSSATTRRRPSTGPVGSGSPSRPRAPSTWFAYRRPGGARLPSRARGSVGEPRARPATSAAHTAAQCRTAVGITAARSSGSPAALQAQAPENREHGRRHPGCNPTDAPTPKRPSTSPEDDPARQAARAGGSRSLACNR